MIKPARFFIAFFISVAFSFSLQAQTDSNSFLNQKIKTEHFFVQKQTEYIHFKSDSAFQFALKNKKLTAVYSVVSIVDTAASVPRKKTAVIQAYKIIIPFDYDSIAYTTGDEFICKKHILTKRSYACNYIIIHATSKQQIDFKAKAIHYIGNNVYLIHSGIQHFFYNSSTLQRSPTFDSYTTYDSNYYLIQTAALYQLLDQSAKTLTADSFKEISKTSDTSYSITRYPTWDMYKNTERTIYLSIACDSILPSTTDKATWNVYRNNNIYYRRNVSIAQPRPEPFQLNKNWSDSLNISKLKYDTIKTMLRFDSVYYQSDNLLMYKKGDGYGYCDTIGNVKITHQYDTITAWHNNIAAIRMKNKWGYVNKREQMIVQTYYSIARPFIHNAAAVFDGKRWLFINTEGKNINSVTYDSIRQTVSGKWYVYNKGLIGLCDIDGREMIPPLYTVLLDTHSDVYLFQHESFYGLIAKDRSILCKPTYTRAVFDSKNNYYLLQRPSTPATPIIRHTQY